jgi:hypothetical protein
MSYGIVVLPLLKFPLLKITKAGRFRNSCLKSWKFPTFLSQELEVSDIPVPKAGRLILRFLSQELEDSEIFVPIAEFPRA